MDAKTGIQLPATRWKLPNSNPESQSLLTREFSLHPVIAQILVNRAIVEPSEAGAFLNPSLNHLHNPYLMKDMKKGVERVIRALHAREKIVIYGDYDADGVTSVAVLFKFLRSIGADVSYRIPDRSREGYSLNREAIDALKDQGASLIVTVDCGISDHDEIRHASSFGIDTVVLDHHEIPERIPDAVAVINTNRPDCSFPFKHLAGVGIAFNFLIALRGKLRECGFWADRDYPNLREYLDLVALGTIGDISPLIGENRIFVKIGLELMNGGRRVGIQALKEISGLSQTPIESGMASFSLIPRINAAGRIASAESAVRMLLTEDRDEALSIARALDAHNRERQIMEKKILEEILEAIRSDGRLDHRPALVFASEEWHPGIIGIVASRLVDLYYRPTILISLRNGIGKGSGRSISEFNLHEGLNKCQSLLLTHGGHRYAAGISIREEDIDAFRMLLEGVVMEDVPAGSMLPQTAIDAHCQLNEINADLLHQLGRLAPFGSRNPEPVFCARNVQVTSPSIVGKNHLTMRISGDGVVHPCIWFNRGHLSRTVSGSRADIAFTPQFNHWNGSATLQLKMIDMAIDTALTCA